MPTFLFTRSADCLLRAEGFWSVVHAVRLLGLLLQSSSHDAGGAKLRFIWINPAKTLAQNPPLVRQLRQYPVEVADLLSEDLTVLAVIGADFAKAMELQQNYGLLTNDSINLAAALRYSIGTIATTDSQLASVTGLQFFKPSDI